MKYRSEELTCIACSQQGVDLHHIKTRGAGGCDSYFNLMPLCRKHHTEVHKIGMRKFARTYARVRFWLVNNNWEIDPFMCRWVHNE